MAIKSLLQMYDLSSEMMAKSLRQVHIKVDMEQEPTGIHNKLITLLLRFKEVEELLIENCILNTSLAFDQQLLILP